MSQPTSCPPSHVLRRRLVAALLLAPGLAFVPVAPPTHARVEARLDASAVPPEVERRLYRYLEEYRAADDAPFSAASVASAVPLFRPGEDVPSYWEFQLRARDGSPRGFVLLATAEHDFPVPLAAADGEAPTTTLAARASARGESIRRFWLPMVGHPVAETTSGEVIVGAAGLPHKRTGYDASWIDEPAESFVGTDTREPKIATNLETSNWSSWAELVGGYATAYAIPHALLARSAESAWETEREIGELTEALSHGDVRHVPLLRERGDVWFAVTGEGKDDVEVTKVERGAGELALRIAVREPKTPGFARVAVAVQYDDGMSESFTYDVGPLPPASALASPMPTRAAGAAAWSAATTLCTGDTVFVRPGEEAYVRVFYPKEGYTTKHRNRGDDAAISRLPAVTLEARAGGIAIRDNGGNYWRVSGDAIGRTAAADQATLFTQSHLASETVKPLGYPVQRARLRAADGRYVKIDREHGALLDAAPADIYALCYEKASTAYWAGKDADEAFGRTPSYRQIPAKQGPNTGICSSGCGATAWAMLVGWADGVAHDSTATSHEYWKDDQNLVAGVAPIKPPGGRSEAIDATTWGLHKANSTWAASGCVKALPISESIQYWTAPQVMGKANTYIKSRTSASVTAEYDGAGIGTAEGAIKARDVIRHRRRPVVVGEGHLTHYSLAFGYRKYTYFTWEAGGWNKKVSRERYESSRGWGEAHSHQIPYHTWFVGWIHPNADGWDTHDAQASGGKCETSLACKTNRCDRGFNSTHTSRCIPRDGKGGGGEFCTHNNHCKTAKCAKPAGETTGTCTAKQALGGTCESGAGCTSGRCDTGWPSQNTLRCIPHDRQGKSGEYCSHPNHCESRACDGRSGNDHTGICR